LIKIHKYPTGVKYLHDHITSLKMEVWAHNTSLTLTLFIDVPVPGRAVSGHA